MCPVYIYYCNNCESSFETFQKMRDKPKKRCNKCKKHSLSRVPTAANIVADSKEPKTIGELAQKNTEKMVSEGKLDKSVLDYDNKKEETKKLKSHYDDLNKMSPAQQKRYIYEGKK